MLEIPSHDFLVAAKEATRGGGEAMWFRSASSKERGGSLKGRGGGV